MNILNTNSTLKNISVMVGKKELYIKYYNREISIDSLTNSLNSELSKIQPNINPHNSHISSHYSD